MGRSSTRRVLAAACALVLAVTLGAPASAAETPGTGQGRPAGWHECADATSRCDGRVSVPLDWADPGGKRVSVAFAWLPRKDKSRPAAGTVLANPGGPTEAIGAVSTFQAALGPVLDRQNLLVVDPRGLGRSSPLRCPDIDVREPAAIERCADDLGSRVQFFTADQAVTDFDAVRHALGVPEVTFYGNSYGTLFGQAYSTRFPDRTAAVFLDGVVETGADGYSDGLSVAQTAQVSIRMLDEVCRSSAACRRLPGDARQQVGRLVDLLREKPDPKISWLGLLRMTAFLGDSVLGRETSAAMVAYLHGDTAPLRRLAREVEPPPASDSEFTAPWFAGSLAYTCADGTFPFSRDASPDDRRRQLADFYEREQPYAPFTHDEVLGDTGDWTDWCASWPTPRESPPAPADAAYPDVPVLVVNGQLDSTTPPEDAERVADRYPRSTYVEVRFGDHAGSYGLSGPSSVCQRDAMRAFVAAPSHPVRDPRCSAENYRASGAFPRTAADVQPAVGGGLTTAQRATIAVAYATAADALERRNPYSTFYPDDEYRALRAGTTTYDDEHHTIRLDGARYVRDTLVTGTIDHGDTAEAALQLSGSDLRLRWHPFRATSHVRVTGTIDGRAFTVWVRG